MESEKLFTKAKKVGMTPDERSALQARLATLPQVVRSPYSFFHTRLIQQSVAAVLVVSLVGTSTTFAASNALPGDSLYPVKIHVNEKVESILAVTPAAQAEIAVDQAVRRLDEAEELVHRGRLTPEATREVEDRFIRKSEEVAVRVKALRESNKDDDADKVEDGFSSRVDSRFTSFVKLEDGEGSTTPGVRKVRDTLERHRDSRGKNKEKEELRKTDQDEDKSSGSGRDDSGEED
jgi:hypothetical protein